MARERFIKSDLDEGLGVEGKRPHDTKVSVDEESGTSLASEDLPAPNEQGQNPKAKVKKRNSFDRLSIKD